MTLTTNPTTQEKASDGPPLRELPATLPYLEATAKHTTPAGTIAAEARSAALSHRKGQGVRFVPSRRAKRFAFGID